MSEFTDSEAFDDEKCILCDRPAVGDGEYLTELCAGHKAKVVADDMVIAGVEFLETEKAMIADAEKDGA